MSTNPDPLLNNNPPAPAPARSKLTCEFCECQLTATGDAIKVSDKARAYMKSGEKITELEATIVTLRNENEDLRRKVNELSPAAPPARRGSLQV
jgi:hypothetical protein